MYMIKLLSPVLMGLCAENFLEGQGNYCNSRQSTPSVVRYYEPGKSCYVNGTFSEKCEDRLNGTK